MSDDIVTRLRELDNGANGIFGETAELISRQRKEIGELSQVGCVCQCCKQKYFTDLIIDDSLWEEIKPEGKSIGGGLLCPQCIWDKTFLNFKANKICLGFRLGQFKDIYSDAVKYAKKFKCQHVEFEFNGVDVVISDSSPEELQNWQWECVEKAIESGPPLIFI